MKTDRTNVTKDSLSKCINDSCETLVKSLENKIKQ